MGNHAHNLGPLLELGGIVFDDEPADPSIIKGLDEEISSTLGLGQEYLADVLKAG